MGIAPGRVELYRTAISLSWICHMAIATGISLNELESEFQRTPELCIQHADAAHEVRLFRTIERPKRHQLNFKSTRSFLCAHSLPSQVANSKPSRVAPEPSAVAVGLQVPNDQRQRHRVEYSVIEKTTAVTFSSDPDVQVHRRAATKLLEV
jgi:hypothetical protein